VFNNVLGIYTSRYSSWNSAETALRRVRRQAPAPIVVRNGTVISDKDNKVVLYVQGNPNLTMSGNTMLLSEPTTITVDDQKDIQTFSVVYSKPQKVP
jgi:hypothetical protein